MKKVFYICIMMLTIFITGCVKNEEEKTTKMIDFSDYNVFDVIAWANENNVASKFNYVYSVNNDKEPGSVIDQSVESGQLLTDNVVITVAKKFLLNEEVGKVTIPNVIGKNLDDARNELTALGLQVDFKYTSSSKEKDIVILSDPLPGVSILDGEKIVLTLSSGKRESSVSIKLTIESSSDTDNIIKVYIDGELDRSKTVCLDASVVYKTFTFSGSGIKEIKFKINDEVTTIYTIDFSTSKVEKIE